MARTLIKGDQIQITDFIKAIAAADWTSDTLTVSAAAILAKIQSEIAGVTGAMQYRGDWSSAATDAASVTGIKQGYVYAYNGSGTAPTGVTLENGDTLIAKQDNASITNANHWTVVNVNITGAVTQSNLVESLMSKIASGGSVSVSAPTSGTNAGKLVITGAWPTINGGNAQSGKYVSGITISNGVITVTKADLPTLPDYRQYRVEGETPSGNIDGDNRTFVTNYKPLAENKIAVYLNGVRQKEGDGNDYKVSIPTSGTNISKGVIVFESNAYYPKPGDTLIVDYTTMGPITAN